MAVTKNTTTVNNIQTLSDEPTEQPTAIKILHDKAGKDIKDYINDVLTVEIDDLDAENVKKTGDQTIEGVKTFESSPVIPAPTTDMQASTKEYVDDKDTAQTSALSTHKTSTDHDGRYYTETEVDNFAVKLTGNQTIAGVKTFSSSPIVPTPTDATQAANKIYVDSQSPLTVPADSIIDAKLKQTGDNILPNFNAHLAENAQDIADLQNNKADKTEVNNLATDKADQTSLDTTNANVTANTNAITTHTSQIASLASGAPIAASLVSQMTDQTKNYVYTGEEGGYTAGHWYYWNGSAWTSGGVYQSTGIDSNYDKTVVKNDNGIMSGAYIPKVTYQHSRGDSEMVGTSSYAQPIIGLWEQITKDTIFNRLELPIYAVAVSQAFEYKIFVRDAKATFIPANEVAITSGTLTVENTNKDTSKMQMLYFDTPIYVPKNKYLYILVKMPTPYKVYLKIFGDDGGVTPLRHGFYFVTTSDWTTTLGYASDTGTRYQTAFKSYFEIKTDMLAKEVIDLINTSNTLAIKVNLPTTINAVIGDTIEIFYNSIVGVVDILKYNINFRTSGLNNEVLNKGNRYKNRWIYTPQEGDTDFKVTCDVYDMQNNLVGTGTSTLKVNAVKASPVTAKNVLCIGDSLTRGGEWVTELRRRLCGTGGTPTGLGLTNLNFIGTCGDNPNRYEGYGGWTFAKYTTAPASPETSNVWINVTNGMKTLVESQESVWSDGTNQWQLETLDTVDNRLNFKHYPNGGSYLMPSSGTLTFVSGGGDTTNIVYSGTTIEDGNPFWNSALGRNDFVNYCSINAFSGIDFVYILLGWNELGNKAFTADEHATTEINAKLLIDRIHTDYPNAKIVLMGLQLPSFDGLGTNYGADGDYWNYFFVIQSIFGLNDTYQGISLNAEYSSFVSFANVASQYDNLNNISTNTRPVNTRNATTEKYGTNGVHPNLNGYYQIADVTYRKIMSLI